MSRNTSKKFADEHKHNICASTIDNTDVGNQLQKEITMNEDLKTKSIELDHGNGVLKMENDIMGERLKGLYEAVQ